MRLTRIPGAALVAGAGLFLAMTALLAGSRAPADMPSFRLRAAVPDALLFASGAAFTLAVAIVIGIALSRDRRREIEPVEEPSKLPCWLQALTKLRPLLPLLLTLVVFSVGWPYVESSLLAWSRFVMFAGSDPGAPQPEIPVISLPWLGWLTGLVLLLAGLATLGVALVLLFAGRIARWWGRRAGGGGAGGGRGGPGGSRDGAGRARGDHPLLPPLRARRGPRARGARPLADARRVHARGTRAPGAAAPRGGSADAPVRAGAVQRPSAR